MTVVTEDGRSRALVAMDIYYDGDTLVAGFEKKDQTKYGLPASAPLNVDTNAYQRPLSGNHVENVRSNWDEIAADEPVLSLRPDGSVWVVNGQHVLAAAVMEGEKEMLAWVWFGLTLSGEADLRLKKNFSRGDTALEKFHARLTKELEGPDVATAIVALLDDFGTAVNKAPNKLRGVNCVGTIERIYRRDEGATLRRALKVLSDSYGDLHGEVVQSALIEGVAWFMTVHFGELRYTQLREAMRKEGPDGLGDIARGFKKAMAGSDWINVYRAIVTAYNARTRKPENKLELKTSRYTAQVPARPRVPRAA